MSEFATEHQDHDDEDHEDHEDLNDYDDEYPYPEEADYPAGAIVLACIQCQSMTTVRACSVHLIADEAKKLYSSDAVLPSVNVDLATIHQINSCECQICNMTCTFCKVPLGYKVVEPCQICLQGENNGHFHMFSSPHLIEIFTRDIDDEIMREKAMEMTDSSNFDEGDVAPDQLFLWYLDDQFTQEVDEDFLHRIIAQRQRDIILDLEIKRTAASDAVNRLKETQLIIETMSITDFILLLDAIALCPPLDKKKEILLYCRTIKTTITPNSQLQWTKEIAIALGRILKSVKRNELQGDSKEREDEQTEEEGDGELFWM